MLARRFQIPDVAALPYRLIGLLMLVLLPLAQPVRADDADEVAMVRELMSLLHISATMDATIGPMSKFIGDKVSRRHSGKARETRPITQWASENFTRR